MLSFDEKYATHTTVRGAVYEAGSLVMLVLVLLMVAGLGYMAGRYGCANATPAVTYTVPQ